VTPPSAAERDSVRKSVSGEPKPKCTCGSMTPGMIHRCAQSTTSSAGSVNARCEDRRNAAVLDADRSRNHAEIRQHQRAVAQEEIELHRASARVRASTLRRTGGDMARSAP
jgi:hypothetical protein